MDIPEGLSLEEVREIVIFSLVARKYEIRDKGARHAVGYLNHRGHEATITLVIHHPDSILIHCEGYAVKSNGARRKPEMPLGWITNLRNDVTRRMESKLASK